MSSDYPSDWDSRRKEVYKRDEHTCQNCGRSSNEFNIELHAHHIVPKSKGGTHSTTNLSTMCSDFHSAIHNNEQAPTSGDRSQQSGRIVNFQELFEFLPNVLKLMEKEKYRFYLVAQDEGNGPKTVIRYYRRHGDDARSRLQELRSHLLSFDPYDNPDSQNVGDDFKEQIEELVVELINYLDILLKQDRTIRKYVDELTTVGCTNCGEKHSQSKEFCGNCGNELPTLSKCSNCNTFRESFEQGYCHDCGTELAMISETRNEALKTTEQQLAQTKQELMQTIDDIPEMIEETHELWERELAS